MGFYDVPLKERQNLVKKIENEIESDLGSSTIQNILKYFSDKDTYIRKTAYLGIGKLYFAKSELKVNILDALNKLFENQDEKVRQTVVNAFGEIGKKEADKALSIYRKAMLDSDHSVRNAVIGSLKKMGEKNPKPVLDFSREFVRNSNP